eukprot:TRINITY_DN5313_c0_g1_i2.p1 TRINITY_DN5313_c0_g1~~TRINITY_DN5313_c0_g1_i2.p1  ORF type:complete len:222 (+),score=20.14 TRINITY_DN5313_c0_g1_i2:54-668(+)
MDSTMTHLSTGSTACIFIHGAAPFLLSWLDLEHFASQNTMHTGPGIVTMVYGGLSAVTMTTLMLRRAQIYLNLRWRIPNPVAESDKGQLTTSLAKELKRRAATFWSMVHAFAYLQAFAAIGVVIALIVMAAVRLPWPARYDHVLTLVAVMTTSFVWTVIVGRLAWTVYPGSSLDLALRMADELAEMSGQFTLIQSVKHKVKPAH